MRKMSSVIRVLIPATGMLVLILDSRTALQGIGEGIEICVRTVIPSLFPFFVLSVLLTGSMGSGSFSFLRPLGKLCGIPEGAEGLFVTGFLGGYPVGAQGVAQAYREGQISRQEAHRLLGFCSNCGPAFLFGISGTLFESGSSAWILWGIHVLSALAVGCLLPQKSRSRCSISQAAPTNLSQALERSIRIMASVCGWILLSRCLIHFLDRWFLWALPKEIQSVIAGLLELANGCVALSHVENEGIRFLIVSGLLGFGGLCVGMQTVSVTGTLGTGWYFPGKLMQMALSLSLSTLILPLLYPGTGIIWGAAFPLIPAAAVFFVRMKKEVAFSGKLVYNV